MSETEYVSKIRANPADFLWKDGLPLLQQLDIELSERCNNNCVHCSIRQPENSSKVRNREISAAKIQDILAEAASLGALSVRFTGGEPLLRKDFEEIYMSARKLGLKVLLFTNARLITPRIANLFVKIPPLKRMEITVYGMTENTYESVTRTRGAYSEFRRGVDLLLENNIPFIVKGALLPDTRHEIDEFETWAEKTVPWMEAPPALAMLLNLRDRRDSQNKNRLIKKLRPSPEDYISVLRRRKTGYLKETIGFCSRCMGPSGTRLFTCGSGRGPCVDSYGALQMCLPLRHPDTIYDLNKGSLHDALTVFFPRIRELTATNTKYLERCAVCFLRGLCEQCPAKSWSEHGTLDTPVEYLCKTSHALARDIGLLTGREKGWQITDWRERMVRAAALVEERDA
jgi:radical SAM protein with 4Fe4S-binding SPASM domain